MSSATRQQDKEEQANFPSSQEFEMIDIESQEVAVDAQQQDDNDDADLALDLLAESPTTKPSKYEKTKAFLANNARVIGIAIALAWHILFACEPPFTRRLQKLNGLGALSLLTVVSALSLVTYLPRLVQRAVVETRSIVAEYRTHGNTNKPIWKRISHALLSRWLQVVHLLLTVSRFTTNVYAPRFATAFLVQMITLLSPFITTILSYLLLRERTTWHTIAAMLVTTAAGVAVILCGSDKNPESSFWTVDFYNVFSQLLGDTEQLLGIGIALVSTALHATGAVVSRAAQLKPIPMSKEDLSRLPWPKRFVRTYSNQYHPETLWLTQMFGALVVCGVGSVLVGEDWSAFGRLDLTGWLLIFLLGSLIFVVAGLCGTYMVRFIDASLALSFLPIRLVVTFAMGAVFMGETFKNVYQVLGSAIILAAVTWFLAMQRRIALQSNKQEPVSTLVPQVKEQEPGEASIIEGKSEKEDAV